MNLEQLISEALCLPISAIDYHVSQLLKTHFPDKAFIEGEDGLFNVEEYARAQLCKLETKDLTYNQAITFWRGPETGIMDWNRNVMRLGPVNPMATSRWAEKEAQNRAKNAWFEVEWQGASLDVIVMHWHLDGMPTTYHYWILADSKEIAESFLVAVCAWNVEVRGEVLVFDGGCWQKDRHLFKSIKGATLENLILRGNLKQDIYDDLVQFFAARETYETYGIPWKRGIIFVGPPGNGKTHAVKAIINAIQQPCLYVKSFKVEHRTDEDNIRIVFDRARKSAPCILVLEDLDSLVTSQNRSFFLNELDGFAA
ncbi:MAG TPA: ATP-binding protein, partial [Ktedonobacteraceae bacterium]